MHRCKPLALMAKRASAMHSEWLPSAVATRALVTVIERGWPPSDAASFIPNLTCCVTGRNGTKRGYFAASVDTSIGVLQNGGRRFEPCHSCQLGLRRSLHQVLVFRALPSRSGRYGR